jgi:DNA-binding response OmpR family regulator
MLVGMRISGKIGFPVQCENRHHVSQLQRVLHVEDDPSISLVTRVTLEKLGHLQVCSCLSGSDALTKAQAFDPHLILLDVMMPDMDGPTTLQKLAELLDLSTILVLFMTAKVQDAEIAHYISIGAQDVIIKPFDPMTLVDQLQSQWKRFQAGQPAT